MRSSEGLFISVDGPSSVGKSDTVHGNALACLYAADRYHHLDTEIVPHLKAGEIVITDRYIPSALVMQPLDGVDPDYLWRINAKARRPDLAVILDADPLVVAERLRSKGPHNRLQRLPSSSHIEWHHYRQISQRLRDAGWTVHHIDCTAIATRDIAHSIHERVLEPEAAGRAELSGQQ